MVHLEEERRVTWLKKYEQFTNDDFLLLAEKSGRIVGFACVIGNQAKYDALLDNLHVLPQEKGRGIGRQLFEAVTWELIRRDKRSMFLWVLKGNEPAIQSYRKMRGVPADQGYFQIAGVNVPEILYVWNNLMDG